MFLNFLDELRAAGIQASMKEHLILLEALDRDVIERTPEDFYYLSRAVYVKDEGPARPVRSGLLRGVQGHRHQLALQEMPDIPEEWLRAVAEKYLTPEEMEAIKSLGSWEEIMETLQKKARGAAGPAPGRQQMDRHGRHQPVRQFGLQPGRRPHRRTEQEQARPESMGPARLRGSDNTKELGTRNIKIALRRLRRFAREGAADELDIDATIDGTARQGWLDVRDAARAAQCGQAAAVPRRRRIDGSRVNLSEELFSAATTEFSQSDSSTSPITRTRECGRTIAAVSPSAPRPWDASPHNTAMTISWCWSATPR